MFVTRIEEIDKKKSLVHIEDGESLPLYKGEIRRYGIKEQADLLDEDYYSIITDVLLKRGKERAMHLLTEADRTEKQIREKLEKGRYPKSVIDEVISFLQKHNYINDYDYAVSYIHTYSERLSEKLLREKLRIKGIDRETIDAAVNDTIAVSGYEPAAIIKDMLHKKKYADKAGDIKEKNRIISYLLRKGFKYEDIQEAIREYQDNYADGYLDI